MAQHPTQHKNAPCHLPERKSRNISRKLAQQSPGKSATQAGKSLISHSNILLGFSQLNLEFADTKLWWICEEWTVPPKKRKDSPEKFWKNVEFGSNSVIGSQQLNDKKNIFVTNISAKVVLTEKCSLLSSSRKSVIAPDFEALPGANFTQQFCRRQQFFLPLIVCHSDQHFPLFCCWSWRCLCWLGILSAQPGDKIHTSVFAGRQGAPDFSSFEKILMCFHAFYAVPCILGLCELFMCFSVPFVLYILWQQVGKGRRLF